MPGALPDFVEPMLAKLVKRPFDSDEHWFEVKWDGFRGLSFVEGGGHRIRSRRGMDLTERYPELEFLAGLPPGLVLDGELVVLRDDGRPDFHLAARRGQASGAERAKHLARSLPASYVVFDLLYRDHGPVLEAPLHERRAMLGELVSACAHPRLVLSDGIRGGGVAFFEQIGELELEGMVAKHLDSAYLPGQRTDAWTKIKKSQRVHCLVLGYQLNDDRGLKSVAVATQAGGELRYVGMVGSGLSDRLRAELLERLGARPRNEPLVPCPEAALWVEPGLYCTVSFVEWTRAGHLRAPVFVELHGEGT